MCGQETALRALAILFCASSFEKIGFVYTKAQRLLLSTFFHNSATRIHLTLGYAMSQRNNHAISENIALLILSFALSDVPQSIKWRKSATARIHEILKDQFYSDGSYSQQSFNYQRLATLTLIMALEFYPNRLSHHLKQTLNKTVSASIDFLKSFNNPVDGTLPNFGANDGSITLPLWASDFSDYRPLFRYEEARHRLHSQLKPDAYDELFHWFGHNTPPSKPKHENRDTISTLGTRTGYWISKSSNSEVFLKSPLLLEHRPSQEDFLAIHLRWNDEDIAIDPGTYSYNAPPPWDHGLAHGHQHNTCSPNDSSFLKKKGRFLWTHWPKADTRCLINRPHCQRWEFSLQSTNTPRFIHRRIVDHRNGAVFVFDECKGDHLQTLLHWNLKALDWVEEPQKDIFFLKRERLFLQVRSNSPMQIKSHSANKDNVKGWYSPWYGLKEPCLSYDFICKNDEDVRFVTVLNEKGSQPYIDDAANLWLEQGILYSETPIND